MYCIELYMYILRLKINVYTFNILHIGEKRGRIGLDDHIDEHRMQVVRAHRRLGDRKQVLNDQHALVYALELVLGRLVDVQAS